ncbi:hypothetical protein JCM10449v2_002756 [Rhodotorula kratochvilovae]
MNPSTGISVLSQALHTVPSTTDTGTPLSKRERFGSAATSLKRLVQDEWDRAGSRQEQQLPLPPLRSHSARSSTSYSTVSAQDSPRFVAPPPPKPAVAAHFPPSPPESPDMGDTPAPAAASALDKGKGRQSAEQEQEDAALNAALEASLNDTPPPPPPETPSDTQLREVLEQSRDDELARQQHVDEQERSDLTAALLASSAPAPSAADSTLYRARSQTLPAFSASDAAASAYLPEKARLFPQGRPALPPGAGSAWDDEQREMEMLADAIRISKEEEDERRRIEDAEVEEALRRSEGAATTSGEESAGTATTDGSAEGMGGSFSAGSHSDAATHRREKRRSWLRPPLSSKLSSASASSPPSSPTPAAAPLPPPRPLMTTQQSSAATVTTYRTARESLPFSNLDALAPAPASAPAPPQRPSRPPPPLPPPAPSTSGASPRLPPTPPETPLAPSGAFPLAETSTAPFPSPNTLAIPEQYRLEHDGSPFELPFLTPSSSIRSSNGPAHGHLRPGLAAAAGWDSRSGGSGSGSGGASYAPLSTSSHSGGGGSGERSRRTSGATAPSGAGEADSRSASSSAHSGSSEQNPPLSPLEIRNPDGSLPSVSSAASSRASTTTGSSLSSPTGEDRPVESLWIEDLPVFPAGLTLTGVSAYAGRSMSAIDETTEPASSVVATDFGGADDDDEPVRGRFPEEVSLASAGGLPDEPVPAAAAASTSEAAWIAGAGALRTPPLEQRESSSRVPTLPPGAAAPASSSSSSAAAAAAAAHDMHEDGLRSGYPSPCALELAHACPADGLRASSVVPAQIELASSPHGPEGEPRDAWAIEAHSWVALVRALMWHGDSTVVAARADVARARAQRCAATARLEFRPDDEGLPVLRLVIALVPAGEADAHLGAHRELSVSRPPAPPEGKGKRPASSAAAQQPLASFALPDLLHLPTRLSSLAIQLYTLRHLAGIARATMPAARSPGPHGTAAGYPALRELADAIGALARAAQDREREKVRAPPPPQEQRRAEAPRREQQPPPPPEEQNARLVTRLRDRLRRLKRRSAPVASSASSAESAERRPAFERASGSRDGGAGANKLVKPMPPPRATAVRRSERVLAAEEGPDPRARGGREGGGGRTDEQREMRYLPVL